MLVSAFACEWSDQLKRDKEQGDLRLYPQKEILGSYRIEGILREAQLRWL